MIGCDMKRLAVWAVGWTLFIGAFLLLVPGGVSSSGCWKLVDASAACLAQLAALNDDQWRTRTLPMVLLFAGGYAVIGIAMARTWVRGRRQAG